MTNTTNFNIDEDTINKIGLRLSDKVITPHIVPNTRIFEYPHLDNVFVMESDLYGNTLPENFCFIAFYGKHGFIGTELEVEILKNASITDINNFVLRNSQG